MKKMIMLALVIASAAGSVAQNYGEIKGKVIDAETGEPVEFANVWVEQGSTPIGDMTDEKGVFRIKPLSPGSYDLHIKDLRYEEVVHQGVRVKSDEITVLPDFSMSVSLLPTIVVTTWVDDLITPDNPTKMSISAPDLIQRADVKNTSSMIQSLVPGVSSSEDGQQLYFRGARPHNIATFIDGVKIGGGEIPRVPSNAINNLTVYTGGIPASYGDVTGGVIIIETKGYMDFYRESKRNQL